MAMSLKSDSYSRERKIVSRKKTTDSVGKFTNKLLSNITYELRWKKKVNGKKGSKARHYPRITDIYDYI
jgi:hypothetical protein